MPTVNFEGKIPKGLRAFASKNAHKVSEITAGYGWSTESGFGYDAAYRAGWRKSDDLVHSELADTAKDLMEYIRDAVPCDCEGCKQILMESKT